MRLGIGVHIGWIAALIAAILVAELITALAIIAVLVIGVALLVLGIRGLVAQHRERVGDTAGRQRPGSTRH